MDRKSQLKNVSFGGAWSEQIADDEILRQSFDLLKQSVDLTLEEDIRERWDIRQALEVVLEQHPKGVEIEKAWEKALNLPLAGVRSAEVSRLVKVLEAQLLERLKGIR